MEGQVVIIGERLRALREEKKLSQGDIEEKTGLLRCYTSRIENGHTVPSVETLEKFARALEVPMYKLFYDGEEPPKLPNLLKRKTTDDILWGSSGEDAHMLAKFCRLFSQMKDDDRGLVFFLAQKLARRKAD
jgi:transcriptional regulator with XRE-family HTH domain